MIAKVRKGASFGGCVRYVLNEGYEILSAEGVDAEDAATIIRDFSIQRSGRPEIKQPVGHIAVSFSPDDSGKMTNDFMLKLADEYMQEMGIGNTQYIVVRHHNTDHEHFHIVYNRIDNDLKLISANNDFHRSGAACKRLKERHGLTFGEGKERVNRERLTGADKVKYQIHDEIAACLPHCATYTDLEKRLRQAGISVQYKYRRGAPESPDNVQGVSFAKGDYSFKGSQVDRAFSHANLSNAFSANIDIAVQEFLSGDEPIKLQPEHTVAPTVAPSPQQQPVPEKSREPEPSAPPRQANPEVVKREIHAAITDNLRNCVLLFNLGERLQSAGITMHLKYRSGALHSPDNVQGVSFEKNGLTFKGSEIDRNFSHANLAQTLNQNFEKWFKTKIAPDEPTAPTVKEKATPPMPTVATPIVAPPQKRREQPSPGRPAPQRLELSRPSTPETPRQQESPAQSPPPPNPPRRMCYGVEISENQWDTLQSGGHIFVADMTRKDGSKLSAHVFLDETRTHVFFSHEDPDKFVKYGKYEMRLRDQKQVERGYTTRAIIRLSGGELVGARLSKENTTDPDYKVSWDDPRIAKEQHEREKRQASDDLRRPPAVNSTPPAVDRTTILSPKNGPKFRR